LLLVWTGLNTAIGFAAFRPDGYVHP